MLKQMKLITEDFTFRAECGPDFDIATVSISAHGLVEGKHVREKDTAEVYLDLDQLNEMITVLTHISETIERGSDDKFTVTVT